VIVHRIEIKECSTQMSNSWMHETVAARWAMVETSLGVPVLEGVSDRGNVPCPPLWGINVQITTRSSPI
jgi:hypothetical protein